MSQRAFDEALADTTEAIRLDPKDGESHLLRSCIHTIQGDLGEAFDDWMEAVRLDPKLSTIEPVKLEELTFERRPLSDLPANVNLGYWLGEQNGCDQWQDGGGETLIRAVVRHGLHYIVWQDEPLTEKNKEDFYDEFKYRPHGTEYEEEIAERLATVSPEAGGDPSGWPPAAS